ncbi:hypothetical protein ACIA49_13975 [Kribbella sp. NPDC051587]|uniref:hypothetical protein n=1 Tax=Kribbella sp. NPDC051587 TaxID=3364119 RepID=UPI0037A549F5
MGHTRLSAVLLAGLLLAGCGGQGTLQSRPGAQSPTPSASRTPTPTPTPTAAPTPTPVGCSGVLKNGQLTMSGAGGIFVSDGGISCGDGVVIGYERMWTAVRFSYGARQVTLGPKKSANFAGYRIRVGVANSRQATFTLERVKQI